MAAKVDIFQSKFQAADKALNASLVNYVGRELDKQITASTNALKGFDIQTEIEKCIAVEGASPEQVKESLIQIPALENCNLVGAAHQLMKDIMPKLNFIAEMLAPGMRPSPEVFGKRYNDWDLSRADLRQCLCNIIGIQAYLVEPKPPKTTKDAIDAYKKGMHSGPQGQGIRIPIRIHRGLPEKRKFTILQLRGF